MPPDAFTAFGEGGVFLVRERPTGIEDAKILVEFCPRLWGAERHGDCRMLEDEAVPGRGSGGGKTGRVLGRGTKQRSPPKGSVGDDRQPEGLGDWEYISLGTTVGRVVADHDGVKEPTLGHLRRECPLVTRNTDTANSPVPSRALKVAKRAVGRGDLLPLVHPLDVVEGEQVDVVGPENREGRSQFRRGIGLVP